MTAEELGPAFDRALKAGDFTQFGADMARAGIQAYTLGGDRGLRELALAVNSNSTDPVAQGKGPVFVRNGDKLEVHFAQQLGNNPLYDLMPEAERAKQGIIRVPDFGYMKDLKPPHVVSLEAGAEKPEEGGNLKPKDPQAAAIASAYGLTAALESAKKFLTGDWTASNGNQQEALKLQKMLAGDLSKIPTEMLDALASQDLTELNAFLEKHGFGEIKLERLGQDGIGMVSAVKLEGRWAGKETGPMTANDGNEYAAFKLKDPEAYQLEGHDAPVFKIFENDEGLKVYVTPYTANLAGLDASAVASRLIPGRGTRENQDGYTAIQLPKVDLKEVGDIPWLLGMTHSSGHQVDQAKVARTVKMDQDGFEAREGLAIAMSRGIAPPDKTYQMKDPMLFIVAMDGLQYPLFATRIDYSHWRDPKATK